MKPLVQGLQRPLCTDHHLLLARIAFSQAARPDYPQKCHITTISWIKKKKKMDLFKYFFSVIIEMTSLWIFIVLHSWQCFLRPEWGIALFFMSSYSVWWNKTFLSKTFVWIAYNVIEYFLATSRIMADGLLDSWDNFSHWDFQTGIWVIR